MNKEKKDNMFNEKQNDNINIITEPKHISIELNENSYLLFIMGINKFTVFLKINDNLRLDFSGKTLTLCNYKPTIENTTNRYYLTIENQLFGIDRNIYDTIKKFLFENNLKYTTEWDLIYEEYEWKIQKKTEKEDQ